MGDPGSSRTTADRLHAALTGQDDRPVDVTALVCGAQHAARRIRLRRRVVGGSLALVLLASTPVALGQFGRLVPVDTPPPAALSSAPEPVVPDPGEDSSDPAASIDPSISARLGDDATEGPMTLTAPGPQGVGELTRNEEGDVVIPDEAMLTASDLPFAAELLMDMPGTDVLRTMATSLCSDQEEPGGESVVGGRDVLFAERADNSVQASAETVVLVFSGDGAQQQMSFLRESIGSCDYDLPYQPQDATGIPGDAAVLGSSTGMGLLTEATVVVGATRVGRTTAGVKLTSLSPPEEAVQEARNLLTVAHQRLVDSGLPASAEAMYGPAD